MSIVNGGVVEATDFVGNPAPFFSIETTTGTTHSLTTVANQRVVVFVKGGFTGTSSLATIELKYNGVTKDSVPMQISASGDDYSFALMYSEVPGAGTQNITVTATLGTISNVKIVVQKLLIG